MSKVLLLSAMRRSSRLGSQWRVIYRVEAAKVHLLVTAVAVHDYQRT
ncbi:hypothetical protein [Quisquiliibacterium transsilvanicum]|uniref:Uncharacterized protein n=1 Tax=Quisquiliibacterium transsilvanicum TaxID=1549638 RepID=A0A7W8HM39_9BURK|nr:hypothetical protein [Quisquiliibacterium transsilvanicum]MBB5273891.1 hypothetical protein [Quisquiliibacterium transsilvanicum]